MSDEVVLDEVVLDEAAPAAAAAAPPPPAPFHTLDTFRSDFPVVKVELCRPPTSDQEIDRFMAEFVRMLQVTAHARAADPTLPKLCLVMDVESIGGATFSQQLKAASLVKMVKPFVPTSLFCTALVVRNESANRILRIILAMVPLTSVNQVFAQEGQAVAWARLNRDRQAEGLPPAV